MKLRKLTSDKDFDSLVKLKDVNLEDAKNGLRAIRQQECYNIVDRGAWYDGLDPEEKQMIQTWRKEWKDVTDTFERPVTPDIKF